MASESISREISDMRHGMHKSVDRMMDQAESMREITEEKIVGLKDKAVAVKENADGYIKENPEKSVLIAAGVGAVLGAILTAYLIKSKE